MCARGRYLIIPQFGTDSFPGFFALFGTGRFSVVFGRFRTWGFPGLGVPGYGSGGPITVPGGPITVPGGPITVPGVRIRGLGVG